MQAIRRDDEHHQMKHQQILSMIKNLPIETVFFGDSLIRRWEEHPDLWQSFFSAFKPANFGMGADRLENMKWRLTNGELEGFEAKLFIFLGGTNNLEDQSAAVIADSIKEIIGLIKEHQRRTKIILLGLFPRNPNQEGRTFAEQISEVNDQLARFNPGEYLHFLDLGPLLSADGHYLDRTLSDDGLHLNAEGYRRIGPPLQKFITEIFTQ